MGEKWFGLLSDRRAQTLDDTPESTRGRYPQGPGVLESGAQAARRRADRSRPEPISANQNKMGSTTIIMIIKIILRIELIAVTMKVINPGGGGISHKNELEIKKKKKKTMRKRNSARAGFTF